MNTYRYTFAAACPGNGEHIIYQLELRHPDMVRVEHIKTACALHREGFQEAIAQDLHARFGGVLILRANHHGVDIETRLAPTPAAQADSQPMLRDWTTSDDPVQALDAIMAVYEKCMGTTPGPEMAHVVSKTKEMLFDWWGRYRERAREALTKADSVLEDAELLEFEMQHGAAINAARKQGGTHD